MSDIDLLPDAYSDKEVIRTKTFLFVADLARKGSRFHGKKTQLYMWNLIIVAVFYALPVLQLVIIYQKVSCSFFNNVSSRFLIFQVYFSVFKFIFSNFFLV